MASKVITTALRVSEFLWILLVMSLIGNMIAEAVGGNTSIVNYCMFAAVFAMLSLFFLIPSDLTGGIGPGMVPVALDALNSLILFCGAVALAAYLGAHSCDNKQYLASNRVCNGTNPGNRSKRCREAQASCAFLWFAWASFTASAVLSFTGRNSGGSSGGGIRRGGPSMRQV